MTCMFEGQKQGPKSNQGKVICIAFQVYLCILNMYIKYVYIQLRTSSYILYIIYGPSHV